MLIAHSSEPLRRATALRGGRAWFAALLLLSSGGCFFPLAPLEDDGGIGGSSGLANIGGAMPMGGGSGGEPVMGTGGLAGAGISPSDCPLGQKRCNDICQPITAQNGCESSACAPCLGAPHAIAGCIDGQCAIVDCEPNFADCNGDTITNTGAVPGDGCEYSLGAPAAPVSSLDIPLAHIQVDGQREDWGALPSYEFKQVCSNCADQATEPVSADSTVPLRVDLDGRFRVAWDQNKFYLLVEAFDQHLFDAGVAGGKCQHPAECEDDIQVFFAGRNNRNGDYANDNQRIFIGLSQRVGAPSQGQPSATDVEVRVEKQSNLCYRIEAQIDWAYITATKGGAQAPEFFPPKPGNQYGFNMSLNDWDPSISDPTKFQRQSQIFWTDAGPTYATKTTGLGTMTLVGGGDAGL